MDEDFRDGSGAYVDDANCGTCGVSCSGAIPNATATCNIGPGGGPRCEVASCDPGYYLAGPLTCLPATDNTCESCATDANCPTPGDMCLSLDGGTFCGRDCAAGNLHDTPEGYCPAGYTCAAVSGGGQQCVPDSGSCTCLAGDGGETRTCIRSNAVGTCYGTETCDPASGWTGCTARVPSEEICDAIDNDCNSAVDDVAGRGTSCAITNAYGTCGGVRDCVSGQADVQCVGQTPAEEICNYFDDDCDGQEDEGFTDLDTSCSEGVGACRRFGFYVCTGDGSDTVCNAVAGSPTTELCDNVDNDCDGSIDEDPAWADKGQPCSEGLGVCQVSGVFACSDDGSATVCSQHAPTPSVSDESGLCNELDDDCDGSADEDFPTKGDVCSSGLGVCRAFGNYVCAADGSDVECDATAGTPQVSTEEGYCDLLDNDCDGLTDEEYLDAQSKYYRDDACGNCFTDCTEIYDKPQSYGLCDTDPATPTCQLTCCSVGDTHPSCTVDADFFNLNDVPDDGCEFQLDTDAIYVSGSSPAASDTVGCGRGPVGTGGGHYPCATIGYALSVADSLGRSKVLVADGLYEESVTLIEGISLLGGYRADTWERNVDATNTTIRGVTSGFHVKTIIADGISSETTLLEGFIIDGASNFNAGGNSYAIWVRDCTSALRIDHNIIFGGDGGAGDNGGDGGVGGDGGSAQQGERSILQNSHQRSQCQAHADTPGNISPCWNSDTNSLGTTTCGNGGSNTCGGADVSGGQGAGAVCPNNVDQQPNGATGFSAGASHGAAGTAGVGGHDRRSSNCGSFNTGSFNAVGLPGGDGGRGSDAGGGQGCSAITGSVSGGEWTGSPGSSGAAGTHGGGGGGGGAGGGADVSYNCSGSPDDTLGGSGGGGGAGGCGGDGGDGGDGGGGAFVIFITNTSTTAAANLPLIRSNTMTRGVGGDGGNGGIGGKGGLGGEGADGGLVFGRWAFAMGNGGRGGQGGDGGHGGGGGGGCGGASYGIYVHNQSGTPTYHLAADANVFMPGGGGGTGGAGGASNGNGGHAGSDGAAANWNY